MRTLAELIDRNARFHANRPAVADAEGRRFTHAEHAARIRRLAAALLARGGVPGARLSILSQNRPELLEAYGAAEVSAMVAAPLNWRLAPAELAAILDDADPALLLVEDRFLATAQAMLGAARARPLLVPIDDPRDGIEALVAGADPATPLPAPAPEDIAALIYTSGTTGRAKGAMLSHAALLHSASAIASLSGERPTDRALLSMPLFHVGAKVEWLALQSMGASCVLLRQFDPALFLATVERERITMAHLAPVMVKTLVDDPRRAAHDLTSLRKVHYGSAPVLVDELRRAVAAFGPVFTQLYGMTEHIPGTMLLPHQQELDGDATALARLASAGQPYPGTDIRILGADGQDLPTGEVGEIAVRSPGMMAGYRNLPAETAAVLRDGWLLTGDVGRLDADGFLFIVDRKKDVIISGGENVHSREVEDVIALHPGVAEVAVIGVPDPRWGEAVMAYVVPRAGAAPEEAEIIAHVRARIASYKKPRQVVFVPALPRLPHGKVDKKALRARHWPSGGRQVS